MSEVVNEHATPEQHPDDAAVDRFAASMKAKLAKSRAKGRSGWEDKSLCSAEYLSELLRGHVDKGDLVDVANFCMMLQQRGEGIAAAPAQGHQVEWRTTAVMLEQANAGLAQLNGKLRAELSALKAQQVGQEPAGEVHLRKGGGIRLLHVELAQPLPPGTKLYTAPQPAPATDVAGWISVAERLPSCGQAVLAYYLNRQGMGRRIRAEYVTRWTIEAEMFADPDTECVEYSEQDDTYYVTEGWYELIDNWDEYARIAVNEGVVTRWMPLPAAPTHDKQSGEVKP